MITEVHTDLSLPFTLCAFWESREAENTPVKYNHFWQDVSSLKEVDKQKYHTIQ